MSIEFLHPKKIAVIGSGISGLSCAWLLNQKHDVTLFEKDDRLGGHANTVDIDIDKIQVSVDTGFIVYNLLNYPNLVEFFRNLNVKSVATEMSFAVSAHGGKLEYSGTGLSGLFAQRRNVFNPRFWVMLKEIRRFYKQAESLEKDPNNIGLTLGELLNNEGYSQAFIDDHLIPMGAAIWSTPVSEMLDYPAQSFLRFCRNHGLLQLSKRPQWRTVVNGSRSYVDKIGKQLKDVRLNSRVHKVSRKADKVYIHYLHGEVEVFDDVVFACHSNQVLEILEDPTQQEKDVLGSFPYQRNIAYLHSDVSLMPKKKRAWSSWNYLTDKAPDLSQISLTYWMNKLQPLNTKVPLFVSLNPPKAPKEDQLYRSFFYDHPVFNKASIDAQQKLWSLQGQNNSWFCGAYFGYGFHEDGLQAGLAVAEQLGLCSRPWKVISDRVVTNF